jgi:hypothetical protein
MISKIITGPSLLIKIKPENGFEQTIGYATDLQLNVAQGQKEIFGVDSPFPFEIAQGAAPSLVRGTMAVYVLKGTNLETIGLVPYRSDDSKETISPNSKYIDINIYDRASKTLIYGIKNCKVSSYTISVSTRNVLRCSLTFSGILLEPG